MMYNLWKLSSFLLQTVYVQQHLQCLHTVCISDGLCQLRSKQAISLKVRSIPILCHTSYPQTNIRGVSCCSGWFSRSHDSSAMAKNTNLASQSQLKFRILTCVHTILHATCTTSYYTDADPGYGHEHTENL